MRYQVNLLKDIEKPGSPRLVDFCQSELPGQTSDGEAVFGTFLSLFGLASNELYVITRGDQTTLPQLPDGMALLESSTFLPTIRPAEHNPAKALGIYVFRWFQVAAENVDEIVALSGEAWPDFERSFETKVQGLFVEDSESPEQMLLLTWYKDLSVWEASRHPPESSRENFLRRHRLTRQARPIATMLAANQSEPSGLVSHT